MHLGRKNLWQLVIRNSGKSITSVVGKVGAAESEGLYVYNLKNKLIVLADFNKIQIPCGTYVEIQQASSMTSLYTRSFLGFSWKILSTDIFKAIVRA